MSRPVVTSVTLAAAVANGYCLSQTPGAAGALTLNGSLVTGGVGVPDAPRRVLVSSAGNDAARVFTITGTARSEQGGVTIVEAVTGVTSTNSVYTNQDFATVTSVLVDAATAGAITVGTNGVGSGPWVVWDGYVSPLNVGFNGKVLSGSPTWQVEQTNDDVFGTWLAPGVTYPDAITVPPFVSLTGQAAGPIAGTGIRATRLTLTAVGGVRLTQQQQGM